MLLFSVFYVWVSLPAQVSTSLHVICSWGPLSPIFKVVQNGSFSLGMHDPNWSFWSSNLSRCCAIRGSSPVPLLMCVTGAPLSPSMVNAWVRFVLKAAGVPGNYSSHSFRFGTATSAALADVLDHVIKILGRWFSDCYSRYIRTPPHVILQTARHIV